MNSGQYQPRPQLHSLPINFQYSDGPELSEQSTSSHRNLSCDGLPRSQQQASQHFMTNTPVSSSTLLGTNYNDIVNSMPLSMSQGPLWAEQSQHASSFEEPSSNNYYDYSPGLLGTDNNGLWLRDMEPNIPRFMPSSIQLYNTSPLGNYDSSMYMMPGHKPDLQHNQTRSSVYPSLEEPRDHFARLSISHSPGSLPKIEDDGFGLSSPSYENPPPFMASKASSDDGAGISSREMTAAVDLDEPAGAEEPYAKLIYRALMSAPNHTMVLQEIYQWFRDNTTKGSADGKGWMNSIRHNLSMNAAFKKTERKLPGSDESKKSTEWVLEPFAIKDGVQSTTRYRKGTSAKKFNHGGMSSRQSSSGRKGGGNSPFKTKLTRQRNGKEDRGTMGYDPRPAALAFNVGHGSIRSTSLIDDTRRAQFERHSRTHISNDRRQRSPITPPARDMATPESYFSSYATKEQMDHDPYGEYAFEDCQGVFLGDGGPLFTHGGHETASSPFHHAAAAAAGGSGSSTMSTSRY